MSGSLPSRQQVRGIVILLAILLLWTIWKLWNAR